MKLSPAKAQRREEDPRASEALASSLRLCGFAGEIFFEVFK
jgi:hypothetical protein